MLISQKQVQHYTGHVFRQIALKFVSKCSRACREPNYVLKKQNLVFPTYPAVSKIASHFYYYISRMLYVYSCHLFDVFARVRIRLQHTREIIKIGSDNIY